MSEGNDTPYQLDRRALLQNAAAGVAFSGVAASPAVSRYTGPRGDEFAAMKAQRLALAEEVTSLSPSINKCARPEYAQCDGNADRERERRHVNSDQLHRTDEDG